MFERYRAGLMAAQDAPGGGGTPPAVVESGKLDVNDLVNQVVGKRVKKEIARAMESFRGDLMSLVKEAIGQKPAEQPTNSDQSMAASNDANEPVKTIKALQEKYEADMKALKAEMSAANKARAEAEAKARDAQVRSQVQAKLAARLGADNPAVGLLMDSLYDVKKRFIEQDGHIGVRFKSAYGDEDDIKSLEEAIPILFDKGGELHHFVANQSKAPGLPPGGVRGIPQTIPNGQPGAGRPNPLYEVAAAHFAAQGEKEVANHLASMAVAAPNGTSQK